ncbi:MAG: Uncharacterised protein [Cryomorphaceae bacterium]|nr:MAG: Uncharacterised protein [Cryomorphaceae bacterium]
MNERNFGDDTSFFACYSNPQLVTVFNEVMVLQVLNVRIGQPSKASEKKEISNPEREVLEPFLVNH